MAEEMLPVQVNIIRLIFTKKISAGDQTPIINVLLQLRVKYYIIAFDFTRNVRRCTKSKHRLFLCAWHVVCCNM